MMPRSALWSLSLALIIWPVLLLGSDPPHLDRYGDPLPEYAISRLGTVRLCVDQNVLDVGFWPDDRTLAACCSDGSVRFWERATGRAIERLQTPLSSLRTAVFVPGTKSIALFDEYENKLLLWDSAATKTVWVSHPFRGAGILSIAASPDGKVLAVAQHLEKVALFEVASGRKIRSLEAVDGRKVVFSPDSTLVATACDKPPAQLWDVRNGKKIRDLPGPEKFFASSAIAFSPDAKMVVVGSSNYGAVVSEVATGKEMARLQFDDAVSSNGFVFTVDGQTLISGHDSALLRFWNPATGKERCSRRLSWEDGARPVLSHDGKVLSALGDLWGPGYRFIHFLDPATGQHMGGAPAEGHEQELNFIAFSANGKMVLTGDRESLREWKTTTGEQQKRCLAQGEWFGDDVAVSANRKLLALTSIERKSQHIDLWEPGSDQTRRSLEYKGKDLIRAVAFSPDGKHLISIHNHCYHPELNRGRIDGEDGLHVWDMATGKELRDFHTSARGIYSQLVITPDGRMAIAGSVNGNVNCLRPPCIGSTAAGGGQLYFWDLRSGRELRRLEGHRWAIRALALSGDGWLLASADAYHCVRICELISGKTLFVLPVDATDHPVMALSPDGRLVAIGTDSSLRVHSTATGKTVLKLRGYNAKVWCVAFSPDNQLLASGLRDGTALVWDVSAAYRAIRPEIRPLNAKELESLWIDLADTDARKAHRAIEALIAAGDSAVGMLKSRLRPAESVGAKRLQMLLADLDSDEFRTRESAMQELTKLGERAEPALGAALKDHPSLEARKRIEELLKRSQRREWTPEQLRKMRALRVLEQTGSAEAAEILRSLATGSSDACLTQQAKASLTRLDVHKSEPRP